MSAPDPFRQKLVKRLEQISFQYDATWLSTKGKWCRITKDGLLSASGAIPYGRLGVKDLELILQDNERDIRKDELEFIPHEEFMRFGKEIQETLHRVDEKPCISLSGNELTCLPDAQNRPEIKKNRVDGYKVPLTKKNQGESNLVRLKENDKEFVNRVKPYAPLRDDFPF
ncbi:MAG: hypothetical protein ACE5EK_00170 [Nitrospinales bacterium]